MIEAAGGRRRGDSRFKIGDDGGFDLQATAFLHGLTVPQLEARLAARRRQTARVAYTAFALGWLFLLVWEWRAMGSPLSATRVVSALEFLPFCVLLVLVAFQNALVNFQIRTRRLAGWRDYLMTSERFWPR